MMMLESSQNLDVQVFIQTPHDSDPALVSQRQYDLDGNEAVLAPIADAQATKMLAEHSPIITFENEFVDLPELAKLSTRGVCFRPPLSSLELVLDKFEQRSQLQKMGLTVPAFASIIAGQTPESLGFSYPIVIKSRRHGYDGQGTHIIQSDDMLQVFWQENDTAPPDTFMVEAFVPFDKELAVIAARSLSGEIEVYPVVETYQPEQVCRWAITPVQLEANLVSQIREMVTTLLAQLDYVGILALEIFLTHNGDVLVNELAPRTHNSGHLTIEACETSQFAQHLRAVAGLSLGKTTLKTSAAVMINLLGFENAPAEYQGVLAKISQRPNTFVHWYHKQESRIGRKLGHVTVLLEEESRPVAIATAQKIEALWYPSL